LTKKGVSGRDRPKKKGFPRHSEVDRRRGDVSHVQKCPEKKVLQIRLKKDEPGGVFIGEHTQGSFVEKKLKSGGNHGS